MDYYLKFKDEAEAASVLYETKPSTKPVLIDDLALEAVLDKLPLADAQLDQTVEYKNKKYMADEGKWFELVDYQEPIKPYYNNIDTLGILYEKQEVLDPENPPTPIPLDGWHVNVRLVCDEDGEPLDYFKVNPEPQNWRRVWG